jgi:hypothetical protein
MSWNGQFNQFHDEKEKEDTEVSRGHFTSPREKCQGEQNDNPREERENDLCCPVSSLSDCNVLCKEDLWR